MYDVIGGFLSIGSHKFPDDIEVVWVIVGCLFAIVSVNIRSLFFDIIEISVYFGEVCFLIFLEE